MKKEHTITIARIVMVLSVIVNWILLFTVGGGTDAYWGSMVVWGLSFGFFIGASD